jgi:hypothetical protein
VGFVVDKVALGQVFPRVLRFFPVNFIPPVLHYTEKQKNLIIFITVLHNKPQGCGASVAPAAGPFTTKKKSSVITCASSNCHFIKIFPAFTQDHCVGYQQITNFVLKVCDVGNAEEQSRHILYDAATSI